jgi:luciferase-like monooxygenase
MNSQSYHIKKIRLLSVLAIAGKRIKNIPGLALILDEQIKLYTFLFHPLKFQKMQELVRTVNIKLKNQKTYHRYGGIEFQYGKKEIAHMHSNGLLDIYFPKQVSAILINKGFCEKHHVYPKSGWTSSYIKADSDIAMYFQLIEWSLQLKTGRKTISTLQTEIDLLKSRYEK